MKKLLKSLFDCFFPLYCAGCEIEGTALCPGCAEALELCRETGFRELTPGYLSAAVFNSSQNYLDGLASVFIYEKSGVLAKLLHFYKYESMKEYGTALTRVWTHKFPQKLHDAIEIDVDMITWIPLHRKKLRQRGFNQSQKLAQSIPCSPPREDLLIRYKNSREQMSLSRQDRLVNVEGAFSLSPVFFQTDKFPYPSAKVDYLAGKTVLIVDDVYTTGATLNAAAKVLKDAGATKIYGLVLARQEV